jgi:hypothetical protein
MAELTQEQIERVAQAIRESAYPGTWDKIRDNEKPIYLRAAHAAIRVAQLPWDEATTPEIDEAMRLYRSTLGGDREKVKTVINSVISRRNSPQQCDPLVETVTFHKYTDACSECGVVIGIQQQPKHIAWHKKLAALKAEKGGE